MKTQGPDGLLVLDKPGGMTSRAAVDRAACWFPRGTRIGHTGTLDPLATGVLVLCVGVGTRLTEYVQRMAKTYTTRIRLGVRSDTDDADGTVVPVADALVPGEEAVREAVGSFVGRVSQVPPAFSAAKVRGARAYDLARKGTEVNLPPRVVEIHGIDLVGYSFPHLDLEVRCGKGTYIRSLARDLGEKLGCGGLVEVLRRTRVGPFTADQGLSLEDDPETARARLLPVGEAAADLPRVTVSGPVAARLRSGQRVEVAGPAPRGKVEEVAVFEEAGGLVALARREGGRLRPTKVFGR